MKLQKGAKAAVQAAKASASVVPETLKTGALGLTPFADAAASPVAVRRV